MAKDFGKDYGVRPALFKNYPDMMSTVSKKAVFDVRVEPDSEFEKPYLTDDYNEQQQIHQLNFAVPYLPPAALGVSATNPTGTLSSKDKGGNLLMDAKGIVDGAKTDYPEVGFGTSIELFMDGFDRNGQPWNQGEITWKVAGPVHGQVIGRFYTATDAESETTINDNVFGVDTEGNRSNILVKTRPKMNVVYIGAGAPYVGTGGGQPYDAQDYTFKIIGWVANKDRVVFNLNTTCPPPPPPPTYYHFNITNAAYADISDYTGEVTIQGLAMQGGAWNGILLTSRIFTLDYVIDKRSIIPGT